MPKSDWKSIASNVITKLKPLEKIDIGYHTEINWRQKYQCHIATLFLKSSLKYQQLLHVRFSDTSGLIKERRVAEDEILVSLAIRSEKFNAC